MRICVEIHMGKQRRYSLEKKQEQISRPQFKAFVEPFEWITGDIDPDLGKDILIRIYDHGISTGLSLYVQLKSTTSIDAHLLNSGVISYRFEVGDLVHWEVQDPPVFLVIWELNQSLGWWISVEDAIKHLDTNKQVWRDQNTVQIHILQDNRLDENGLSRIRQILADRHFPILAKDKEFEIKAAFKFPPTPEGKAKLAELKHHIASGDEVEIDGKYIEEFDLPDWWTRLFGELDSRQMKIQMGPTKTPMMHSAQIDFISPELGIERIPYVELSMIKHGQEEITLSNEGQNIPYKFRLVINGRTGENTLNFSINFANIDVFSARQAIYIQQMMGSGGRIQITFIDLNISTIVPTNPGVMQPPKDDVISLVENLCLVQQLTGERIMFPQDGSYSQTDVELADQLVSVVTTGVNRKSGKTFSLDLRKNGIHKIIEDHQKNEPIRFRLSSLNSHAEILSSKIELGPLTQYVTGIWDKPLEDVLTWLELAKEDDHLRVHLNDCEIVVVFKKWIKGAHKE